MNISNKTKYLLVLSTLLGLKKELNNILIFTKEDINWTTSYIDYIIEILQGD